MASRIFRFAGQVVAYAALAALLGYFSSTPSYSRIPNAKAMMTLTFVHAGSRAHECRRLSPDEIAALAPNMRHQQDCPRERVPLLLEVRLDNTIIAALTLPPTGIARDGLASVYRKLIVDPGVHQLDLRLRDSIRTDGFDHTFSKSVKLTAGQHIVIDFKPEKGGFQLYSG